MERGSMGGMVIGLLVGAAIGAGLGLLYAPQSGKKTRREIQKQAMEIKERAEDLGKTVKKRAEEIGENVAEGAEKYRRKMMDSIT